MRLVIKSFDEEGKNKEGCFNFNYSGSQTVILTSEEPSELAMTVLIRYRPPNYATQGDAAYIRIEDGAYTAWKRTQNEEPDLSLLLGQYIEFWTAWNVRATALQEEANRKRLAEEAIQIQANKEAIEAGFPGIIHIETGTSLDGWSYRELKHNSFMIVHKNGMWFDISTDDQKWNVTMRSEKIGNDYNMKRSKNIKLIFKFILESEEVKQYIERHDRQIEQDRKAKVLKQSMLNAGWESCGGEWRKKKDSGTYFANATIADDSDRVTIYKIRRYLENLMLEPHKLDYSIFE
jgi:hypothetical protein